MRWRNVKTGVLVEGPDWLDMPQGIYEVVEEASGSECSEAPDFANIECCEEAPLEGEPLPFESSDESGGEISSADW